VARVGILGGTFNPPHLAHLICASEAASQLRLDRVLLTPVAVPPHKHARMDPGAAARLELCRLAVAGDARLAV
jgi:nicotinate-nucleotide adenylyltransferase